MELQIIKKKTADLIPYARNARTHSEEQIKQIAASIKEFGFNNPVAIDSDNMILCGHGRVLAAQLLKMQEVPCVCLSHLSKTQKKAYILADNKIALNADYDEDILKIELEELKVENFDLEKLGFSDVELGFLNDDEENEPDFLDDFSTDYNITIKCASLKEAQELTKKLGVDLDLTRQKLTCKYKDLKI